MTDKQENKLSMLKAVRLILQNNPTIVSSIPALAAAATEMENEIDSIDGIAQLQGKQITGTAMDKSSAESAAISSALELIGPTKSYAREQNNNALYDSVNYSMSSLQKLRDTTLGNTLTIIRDAVQNNLAALVTYGITAAMVTELTSAISTYTVLVAAPREAINNKSAATDALVAEFKKIEPLLERLDGLVEIKKNSKPDFYNSFKGARVIVDLKGKGKDDGGGTPKPTV